MQIAHLGFNDMFWPRRCHQSSWQFLWMNSIKHARHRVWVKLLLMLHGSRFLALPLNGIFSGLRSNYALPCFTLQVSVLPVVSGMVEEALLRWLRAAELTCDRAALLVAQDARVRCTLDCCCVWVVQGSMGLSRDMVCAFTVVVSVVVLPGESLVMQGHFKAMLVG